MQHAIDQSFTQRAASQRHTLDIHLGENGDENSQPARKNQRTFQREAFDFQLFQTSALDGALF
jgi:hypothetical protein